MPGLGWGSERPGLCPISGLGRGLVVRCQTAQTPAAASRNIVLPSSPNGGSSALPAGRRGPGEQRRVRIELAAQGRGVQLYLSSKSSIQPCRCTMIVALTTTEAVPHPTLDSLHFLFVSNRLIRASRGRRGEEAAVGEVNFTLTPLARLVCKEQLSSLSLLPRWLVSPDTPPPLCFPPPLEVLLDITWFLPPLV